jgi:hypothetical protein
MNFLFFFTSTVFSVYALANSGYVTSERNKLIANEISSRLSVGIYSGLTEDNKQCTVEVKGYSDIVIKTSDYKKVNKSDYDCLSDTGNIVCFEFSSSRYLPQKTLFFNGDLFHAKIATQTADIFHLQTKRNLGGNGEYELIVVNSSQQKSIELKESQDDGNFKRSLKCTINQ